MVSYKVRVICSKNFAKFSEIQNFDEIMQGDVINIGEMCDTYMVMSY